MIYSLLYNHKKTAISDKVNLGTNYDQECHLKVTTECLTTSQSEQERQQMQIEADAKAQAKVEAKEILPVSEESKQSDVIAHTLEKGKAVLSPTTLAHQIETSEIKAVLMVQMTTKEANYLRKRDVILTALENASVDNWSGYDDVFIELYSDKTT